MRKQINGATLGAALLITGFFTSHTVIAQEDVGKAARVCRMLLSSYQKGTLPSFSLLAESGSPSYEPRIKSIFGSRRLQVNADGSSITYSPTLPRGGAGVLDSICSASVGVYNSYGEKLSCSGSESEVATYYDTFKRIRDNGWKPIGASRLKFDPFIIEIKSVAKQNGTPYQIPCVVRQGNLNYFVSVTGLQNRNTPGGCNPNRYVDSLKTKSVVVPKEWILGDTTISNTHFPNQFSDSGSRIASGPVEKGDLVVVYNPGRKKQFYVDANGNNRERWINYKPKNRWIYAIVGEGGPIGKFGEASIALNQELMDATPPRSSRDLLRLDTDEQRISMLILPKTSKLLKGRYTDNSLVRRNAYFRFSQWGGGTPAQATRRFKACEKYLLNVGPEIN